MGRKAILSDTCSSCAFRKGCDTHDKEADNRLRSTIAAMTGVPFFCHSGLNYRDPLAITKGMIFDVDGRRQPVKVCEGWKREVVKYATPGVEHHRVRERRRMWGQLALRWVASFLDATDPVMKDFYQRRLTVMVRMLRWKPRLPA